MNFCIFRRNMKSNDFGTSKKEGFVVFYREKGCIFLRICYNSQNIM